MKKLLPFGFAALLSIQAQAQQTRGRVIAEYKTPQGTTFHRGDTLTFGLGRRDNGTFRYITIAPNLMTPEGMALPSSWANLRAVVRELKETNYGTANGSRGVAVIKAGIYNAVVELNSAEEAGEIKTANNQQKGAPVGGGVADELLKLKALLDAGAITQTEYDTQKAKVLGR